MSVRQLVVSFVALLLALAVGVALGAGPLAGGTPSASTTDAPEPAGETVDFGDRFATASAARLYARGLEGSSVAVVTLPGADAAVVRALTRQVERAGGTPTGTYAVAPALVDPAEKSLIDTLGSQLAAQLDDGSADRGAPTYERMGQLLGAAVGTRSPQGATPDESTLTIRQSLSGGELLRGPAGEARRAPLVLLVLGHDHEDHVLSGLVAGMAARNLGLVVVGDSESGTSGDLASLRSEPLAKAATTVDGVEGAAGQVTAVLALIRAQTGSSGSFGASGSDGAVPLG